MLPQRPDCLPAVLLGFSVLLAGLSWLAAVTVSPALPDGLTSAAATRPATAVFALPVVQTLLTAFLLFLFRRTLGVGFSSSLLLQTLPQQQRVQLLALFRQTIGFFSALTSVLFGHLTIAVLGGGTTLVNLWLLLTLTGILLLVVMTFGISTWHTVRHVHTAVTARPNRRHRVRHARS